MSTDLSTLKAALLKSLETKGAAGIKSMTIGDRSFTYSTAEELLDIFERLERREAHQNGQSSVNVAEVADF